MTRLPKALALGAVAAILFAACGPTGGTSEELASDQTLRFVLQDDIESLDPAHVSAAVDITFLQLQLRNVAALQHLKERR